MNQSDNFGEEVKSACPCCLGGEWVVMGMKDFSHSGNDHFTGERQFADSNWLVSYEICQGCGFIRTRDFDQWTRDDFSHRIYNNDYLKADPPYALERPTRNAGLLQGLWPYGHGGMRLLDYGGGEGHLARLMQQAGWLADCEDPYGSTWRNHDEYDVIASFEVIEHIRHEKLRDWFSKATDRLAPGGVLVIGTELAQPNWTIDHWYLSPRNGHVGIHTHASLRMLSTDYGIDCNSVSNTIHFLRRNR